MVKEVIAIHRLRSVARQRNVGPFRIERVEWCSVQLIRDECQWMFVKASLSWDFAWIYGTSLELEVTLVVRSENTFNINDGILFIAGLNDWW